MADENHHHEVDHEAETTDSPSVLPSDTNAHLEISPPLPEKIGHYTIKSHIGSGGMAIVYLAMQEHPRRKVALKLMKKGITSRSALNRFVFESQILGRLHHPNIAHVYEAGKYDDGSGGVPYFAMEYIPNAKTIIDYARGKNLNIKQRLELFSRVCDAVHHGHQKGIIHRDLKPANILVDSSGVPKVIDFGVARSTDSDMAVTTLQTEVGQLVGTVQYMSPEQCEAEPDDLDTRSDVYALGVVLYELLCDQLPYDVTRATVYMAARVVREEKPKKPSLINKALPDDVETITLKALEKDRERRYESALELAKDIQRFLANEPIEARPPSLTYQMRMFARRNRVVFAASLLVFVVLIVATVVSILFALSANRAEHEAQENLELAQAREEVSNEISDFLTEDLLAAVAPSVEEGKGKDVLMRDVLDEAAQRIEDASAPEGRFADKALVTASIHAALGSTYRLLGEYQNAEPHLESARRLRLNELGEEHPETLDSMNDLANLYADQGSFDDAEPLYIRILECQKKVFGEEHQNTLSSMNNLAALRADQGRYDEAESLYIRTLECQIRVFGEEHPETLKTMNNLAILYLNQGRYDEAEQLNVKTLKITKSIFGEEHPETLDSMNNLAALYLIQGRYDKAEHLCVRTLEIQKRILGEEHPGTLATMNNLAILFRNQGRHNEAEPLYEKLLEIRKRVLGEEHPKTLDSTNNLVILYQHMGRYEEAESLVKTAIEIYREVLGPEHPDTLNAEDTYATILMGLDRVSEAENLLGRIEAVLDQRYGSQHWLMPYVCAHRGICLVELGQFAEAEQYLLDAHASLLAQSGGENAEILTVCESLITLYTALHEAEPDKDFDDKAEEWRAKLLPNETDNSEPDEIKSGESE